jgi:hypothetical protein
MRLIDPSSLLTEWRVCSGAYLVAIDAFLIARKAF